MGEWRGLHHDLHFTSTNESIAHHLSKIAPFQAVFVKDRRASGRPVNVLELTLRSFWRFIRAYFLQAGLSRRMAGLLHCQIQRLFDPDQVCHGARSGDGGSRTRPMKLSLIISTFNQQESLGKVFEGVRRQTRLPDEILISDDGSDASTRALIKTFADNISAPVKHVWQRGQRFPQNPHYFPTRHPDCRHGRLF